MQVFKIAVSKMARSSLLHFTVTADSSKFGKPGATNVQQQPTPAMAPLDDSRNRFCATGGQFVMQYPL